jgi:hypothetical protein
MFDELNVNTVVRRCSTKGAERRRNMLRKMFVFCAVVLLLPTVALADLSGEWTCDDGGRYYLRQVGNTLYWYGERSATNPSWSNVYHGRVQGDRVRGSWADVPKGGANSRGELQLQIRENDNVLVATHKTGGFGGSRWVRAGYTSTPAPAPAPSPTPAPPPSVQVQEDCIGFNPNSTEVRRVNGRWKIVDGSHWMFDFGNKEGEARQALRVIKHYRMNQSCFVGRPDASFEYLLVSGNAPSGSLSGEDCVRFNPNNIEVKRIEGRWKIVDGDHWMFDFGNKQAEARHAFAIIKKYGFNRSCFVGRPNASFQYLRR